MDKRLLLQELADLLAVRAGITKKKADAFTKSFFELVQHGLETDSFVKIKGFGTFKLVAVGERESVNISTGERFQISGHTKVSFTPDPELRDLINRPFAHFQTVVLNDDTSLEELDAIGSLGTEEEEEEMTAADYEGSNELEAAIPQTDSKLPETPAELSTDSPQELSEEMHNVLREIQDILIKEGDLPESQESDTPAGENTPETLDATMETPQGSTAPAADEKSIESQKPDADDNARTSMNGGAHTEDRAVALDHSDSAPSEEAAQDKAETVTADTQAEEEVTNVFSTVAPLPAPTCPAAGSFCWWKAVATGTVVLLLMILSYCAGYFHILCPCDFNGHWTTQTADINSGDERTGAETMIQDSADTTQPTDTIPHENTQTAPDPMPQPQPSEQPAPTKETTHPAPLQPVPAAPAPTASQSTPKKTPSRQFAQVPGGKYIITGTRQKYTLSHGETIRSIAEHVYGSKGYAAYIIAYNRLSNPDNIAAGTEILLPELERADTH